MSNWLNIQNFYRSNNKESWNSFTSVENKRQPTEEFNVDDFLAWIDNMDFSSVTDNPVEDTSNKENFNKRDNSNKEIDKSLNNNEVDDIMASIDNFFWSDWDEENDIDKEKNNTTKVKEDSEKESLLNRNIDFSKMFKKSNDSDTYDSEEDKNDNKETDENDNSDNEEVINLEEERKKEENILSKMFKSRSEKENNIDNKINLEKPAINSSLWNAAWVASAAIWWWLLGWTIAWTLWEEKKEEKLLQPQKKPLEPQPIRLNDNWNVLPNFQSNNTTPLMPWTQQWQEDRPISLWQGIKPDNNINQQLWWSINQWWEKPMRIGMWENWMRGWNQLWMRPWMNSMQPNSWNNITGPRPIMPNWNNNEEQRINWVNGIRENNQPWRLNWVDNPKPIRLGGLWQQNENTEEKPLRLWWNPWSWNWPSQERENRWPIRLWWNRSENIDSPINTNRSINSNNNSNWIDDTKFDPEILKAMWWSSVNKTEQPLKEISFNGSQEEQPTKPMEIEKQVSNWWTKWIWLLAILILAPSIWLLISTFYNVWREFFATPWMNNFTHFMSGILSFVSVIAILFAPMWRGRSPLWFFINRMWLLSEDFKKWERTKSAIYTDMFINSIFILFLLASIVFFIKWYIAIDWQFTSIINAIFRLFVIYWVLIYSTFIIQLIIWNDKSTDSEQSKTFKRNLYALWMILWVIAILSVSPNVLDMIINFLMQNEIIAKIFDFLWYENSNIIPNEIPAIK